MLLHLVSRHRKREERLPRGQTVDVPAPPDDAERAFTASWREEFLARTWEALHEAQPTLFTVLHHRAEHSEQTSEQIGEALGPQLGKKMTAENVRQNLHRARELFADLLLDQVARSLHDAGEDALEQELVELNLLEYCRPALERRKSRG